MEYGSNKIFVSSRCESFNNVSESIGDIVSRVCIPIEVNNNIPENAKTLISSDSVNINSIVCNHGKVERCENIIPVIYDVELINNGITKIVIVKFIDGTSEKAVLSEEDVYSFEQGISVCIAKKLLSMKCINGSGLYNKIIKYAVNVYNEKMNDLYIKTKQEKETADILERKRQKRNKKRIKREKAEREKQIEIQKEAYLRAMCEYNSIATEAE